MKPRLALHLLRSDWLRLRKPLIALWTIMLLTALPWLLHDPESFRVPSWFESSGGMEFQNLAKDLGNRRVLRELLMHLHLAGGLLQIAVAAAVGVQSREWLRVSPLPAIARVTSKAMALLVFIVAPQVLLATANLLLHGFSSGYALAEAVKHGLSALLFTGAVAAFATWTRSLWWCLAGAAVAAGGHALLMTIAPQRIARLLPDTSIYLWMPPAALTTWIFFAAAIILLGGVLARWRELLSSPARIAVAVAALMTTALVIPPDAGFRTATAMTKPAEVEHPGLMPTLRGPLTAKSPGFQRYEQISVSGLAVAGTIEPTATGDGTFVLWHPGKEATLRQGGVVIATRRNPPAAVPPRLQPSRRSKLDLAAVSEVLPGKSAPVPTPYESQDQDEPLDFGHFDYAQAPLQPGPAVLETELSGVLFRYERVVDVPLSEATTVIRDGGSILRIRRYPDPEGEPRAELEVTYPAEDASSSRPRVENYRIFLHLPESGTNVTIGPLLRQSGPLLAGAGIFRAILGRPNQPIRWMNPALSTAGARLVMLKPVVVARLPARPFRAPVELGDGRDRLRDFSLTRSNYGVDAGDYLGELWKSRPDPRTCSRTEFGRWLRIPAASYQASSVAARDLAEFVPRFPEILTKVAFNDRVAEALRLALPESQRQVLLARLGDLPDPSAAIDSVTRRGWGNEVSPIIAGHYLAGEVRNEELVSVLALEDPATYPQLIDGLIQRPNLNDYERIRQLPGIAPELGWALARALEKADHPSLLALANEHDTRFPFGPYLIPAKEGNARAFDALISLCGKEATYYQTENLARLIAAPAFNGNINQRWETFLSGKSSANFRYDRLTRLWHPL